MKREGFVAVIIMLVSLTAFAGKAEREYMKETLGPSVAKAEKTLKESCGCAIKITLNENTQKTTDDMHVAHYLVDSITDGAPGYCNDAESKKAVCQLKTLDVLKEKEAKFTFKAGKGTASHDGQSHTSWEMITRELDK